MFDGHYAEWRTNRIAKVVKIFGNNYFSNKSILELGCGHGHVGEVFKNTYGSRVTFSDGRYEHLSALKHRIPDADTLVINNNIYWDLQKKFDIVIHWGLLYHIDNWKRELLCSSLHTDLIFLESEVADSPDPNFEFIRKEGNAFDQGIDIPEVKIPTAAGIEQYLTELGFLYKRYDSADLNNHIHRYDWQLNNTQEMPYGQRRFWVAYRQGSDIELFFTEKENYIEELKVDVDKSSAGNKEEFTIIIQGKLHENILTMAEYHKDIKTIISVWINDDNAATIDSFFERVQRNNLKVIKNREPGGGFVNTHANRHLQFTSTLYGLEKVQTRYAIKFRSDEYYSNIDKFIACVENYPDRIITNDVFFRKYPPYHISDHVIGGTTENMKSMFSSCVSSCQRDNNYQEIIYPEVQLGRTFVSIKEGIPINSLPNDKEPAFLLMKKYFAIVASADLGLFSIRANCYNKTYDNCDDYFDEKTDVRDINHIC